MKKFELTSESINWFGRKLFRIKALKTFQGVNCGDIGGFIEEENNLSQHGNCWVSGNAKIYDRSKVCGNAHVSDAAEVFGGALISGNAEISGNARITSHSWVGGNSIVYGHAELFDSAWIFGAEIFDAEISCATIAGHLKFGEGSKISDNAMIIAFKK